MANLVQLSQQPVKAGRTSTGLLGLRIPDDDAWPQNRKFHADFMAFIQQEVLSGALSPLVLI
jgi:hypothetical protein